MSPGLKGKPGAGPPRLKFSDLVKQTAMRSHMPEATVRLILEDAFIAMQEGLEQQLVVMLPRFGSFRSRTRKTVRGTQPLTVSVGFRPAADLKESLRKALL